MYWEKVFAVCYHSTSDVELSKEMTQYIFLSIWERRETLQIEKSYEHYLVRAAKYKVAEHFRNQASRKKNLDLAMRDYCQAANCTEQDVCFSMLVDELGLLVDQLPCQCRNVFRMSREEGFSNREIADKLQISTRAVEYHISKALSFLQQNLPDQDFSAVRVFKNKRN
jgi:RNA polymerase sigma-70 factor (ECF subfamily)